MESIWVTETGIRKREPLPGDLETEVVVIGAGMAGILTAYHLQQAGLRTVVLEADRIGSGQTKNTTAKITFQHKLIYNRLIQTLGSRAAFAYASANENAIDAYEKLIREKEIDCDFARCSSYLYSRKDAAPLRREVDAVMGIGIDAVFETDSELPFPVAGVARFDRQARFNPLKFLAAISEEVTVYEQTEVLKVEGNRVQTNKGCVSARHIVFACHYPFINMPGYYFARMHQERSYVTALEGAGRIEGMYLGIDKDGLSFRQQGDMLLLGGGSHRTGRNQKGGQYAWLQDRARELYPESRVIRQWSAQDCMTLDGIPYIGRFSIRRPNWYVATGFGKWGMSSSMAAAHILTALITEQRSAQAGVFSPQRGLTGRAVKELGIHSLYTIKGLVKHLLPAGQGRIVPNCPHMGCRLEWNPEEGTYDCPCHGSRFDESGKLIDGPAQNNCRRR